MKRRLALTLGLTAAAAAILVSTAAYSVGPSESALVVRFGVPVRVVNRDGEAPGLHLKWPFVEQVARLDRRALVLTGQPQEVATAGGDRLSTQAALRYRIADPLRFYQAVAAPAGGMTRLQALLDASAGSALAGAPAEEVAGGPQARMTQALAVARRLAARDGLGVQLEEITLLGAAPADPEAAARHLQASETARVEAVRTEGAARKRELYAEADREAADVRGEGERQALEVRGEGDAERTAILGAAYGRDPEFARFFRRLEAYDQALDPQTTTLVLSPDNAFLDLFAHGPASKAR